MAKIVLTDAKVTINSVTLSSSISSVTLDTKNDILETSAFGGASKTRVAGLSDNSVTLEFFQDFAASSVEATIFPLIGSTTTVVVQPASTSTTTTNPTYTFTALVSEWQPLKGGIGQLATASVTWPISGAITKAVA
jgi:hypothetical protein